MEELSKADVLYLTTAVNAMLRRDLCKADRQMYETLKRKLVISKRGKEIREAFSDTYDSSLWGIASL